MPLKEINKWVKLSGLPRARFLEVEDCTQRINNLYDELNRLKGLKDMSMKDLLSHKTNPAMVMENIKLTEEKIKEREDYKKTLMDKIEEDWDEGDDKEDDVKDDIEDKQHRRAPPRSRQSAQNFRSAQMHQNSWIHTQSYRSSRDYGNSYTIVTSMRRPSSKIRGSHVIIDSKYQHQPEDYYSSISYNKTNVPHRVIPKYLNHDDQSSYYSEPRPAASTKYVPHIIAASQGPDDFYTQPLNTTSESYRRPRCSGGDRGEQRRYR